MYFWMVSGIDLPWTIKPLLQILLKCVLLLLLFFLKEMSATSVEGATEMLRKFNRLKSLQFFSRHISILKSEAHWHLLFFCLCPSVTDTNLNSNVREEKRLVCVRQWTTTTTTCFGCKSSQLWFRCAVGTRQAANWLRFVFLSQLTASLASV